MSRILKVMIVLLAITAMAAPSVFAEDRLSLSGAMRVRGWYTDNTMDADAGYYKDNASSYFDQRFRLGGKLSVAEGVSINFRTDITEATWGSNGTTSGLYGAGRSGSTQQWDRAYIELKKNGMTFRAGQQNFLLGSIATVDAQGTGLYLNTGGAVPVTLMFQRQDNNAGATDANDDIYGIQVSHATDMYSADAFVAYATMSDNPDTEIYVYGVDAAFDFGAFKVKGEVNLFDGEVENTTGDITGTNIYLDGSFAASETVTVGAIFFYGDGEADSSDDTQITMIGNGFNGWDPVGYGSFTTDWNYNRVFDFTGDGAGVIGGEVYTDIKASDALTLTGAFSYLTPEEDDTATTAVDSAYVLTAVADYALMANTGLSAGLEYTSIDYNQPTPADLEDASVTGVVRLQVNF